MLRRELRNGFFAIGATGVLIAHPTPQPSDGAEMRLKVAELVPRAPAAVVFEDPPPEPVQPRLCRVARHVPGDASELPQHIPEHLVRELGGGHRRGQGD